MTNLRRLFEAAALLAILMLPAAALSARVEKRPISTVPAEPLRALPPARSAPASSLPAMCRLIQRTWQNSSIQLREKNPF